MVVHQNLDTCMLNVRETFLFSYARSARRAGGHHRASEPSAARMCKTALGTRGARGASSQQMSARKRKRPDRCSGALISCHSTPLDPCVQQQRRHCIGREAAEDKGHHHVVARQALPLESVRFLIGLQVCRSAVHPTNSTTQQLHLQEEASVCGPFGHIAWGAVSMLRLQARRALLPTRFWTRSLHARLVVHWPRIIRYTR